ncbi:MAG TPA: hypothetical protein VK638_17575 [Edaphobacter sp.]|nr:hypothetical protein [Edaphobacter sp.]
MGPTSEGRGGVAPAILEAADSRQRHSGIAVETDFRGGAVGHPGLEPRRTLGRRPPGFLKP